MTENKMLTHPPLIEAWLELRWKIDKENEHIARDPKYSFALGTFAHQISTVYSDRIALDANRMPEELTPYVVRYRFAKVGEKFPILQIGPGVASVNFVSPYDWKTFSKEAEFLRASLYEAYQQDIELTQIALRYRNAIGFEYEQENTLDFLQNNFNTVLQLPNAIVNSSSRNGAPDGLNINISYQLSKPVGVGLIQIGTGVNRPEGKPQIIWELGVISETKIPAMGDQANFRSWLDQAHDLIETWFFALIHGNLWDQFR